MLVLSSLAALQAQPRLQFGKPQEFGTDGFHIYNIYGGLGYTSQAAGRFIPGAGSDYQAWAGTSLGYSRFNVRNSQSFTYSPSYSGRLRYSDIQSFNHTFDTTFTQKFGTKVDAYLQGTAADTIVEVFLLDPGALSRFARTQGPFIDVGLTGGGALPAAATSLVYGNRMRAAAVSTGVTYRPTERFNVTLTLSGSINQTKSKNTELTGVVPNARGITATVASTYSLDPRTHIGLSGTENRAFSRIGSFKTTTIAAFYDRQLSIRWFTTISAGPTYAKTLTGDTKTIFGSGSLGYRLQRQTLTGTYTRTGGDVYGLGSRSSTTTSGAWDMVLPASGWSFNAAYTRSNIQGGGIGSFGTNAVSATIGKAINRQLSANLTYGYADYGGLAVTSAGSHVARLGLTWVPFLRDVVFAPDSDPGGSAAAPAGARR